MIRMRSIQVRFGLAAGALMAATLLTASPHRAAARDGGDVAAGRHIAETWCGNCHITGPTQKRGTSTGAPTFTAIAAMKTTTQAGLRAFLQAPHNRMPDVHLSRKEIADVSAYILSLRH